MKKYKQYEVKYKNKLFQIVVTPPIEDIFCIDCHPQESTYDISGGVEGMQEIADILKIAISSSSKIIYVPIKKRSSTYNVVISGRYVDEFKPSVWYKLKPYLDKNHRIHNYRLKLWNSKKAIDYIDKKIAPFNHAGNIKKDMLAFSQKELGDTVFMHFSRRDLYEYWKSIEFACEYMRTAKNRISVGWGIGFVFNEEITMSIMEEEKNAGWNG